LTNSHIGSLSTIGSVSSHSSYREEAQGTLAGSQS